jgi:hypothetical protein
MTQKGKDIMEIGEIKVTARERGKHDISLPSTNRTNEIDLLLSPPLNM